ncbi:MFS transporter [Thermaerobacter subterraneus]|uniref:MFS transporter n=1 Tax=Thermaerobacter subterraneus DSM 13965 TaxID=867903 RepID=K6NZI6_9FIRM|nr:MFS transporter [Thermaerobacter subterraneus]EKP94290.1 hypothetical protein ThesuDRAFT_02023 [Thermaerobacter subterraneus DSM 13965]
MEWWRRDRRPPLPSVGGDPASVYVAYRFGMAFLLTTAHTVAALYRIQQAGLGPLELALVGTVLEITVTLCEVPTGVVADLYGRRASVLLGLATIGAGLLVEGAVPALPAIMLGQVLWGLGYTFTSGADAAWIADEVGEERARYLYVRGAQAAQAATLLGIGASVALGSLRLNLPLRVAGAGMWVLALVLALMMSERGYRPRWRPGDSLWQGVGGTWRHGWRAVQGRPGLRLLLAIGIFYGLASEGFDRLWQLHLLTRFPQLGEAAGGAAGPAGTGAVVWIGLLTAGAMLLSMAAAEVVRRRGVGDPARVGRMLLAISMLLVPSVAGFGLAGSLAAATGFYWLTALLRETYDPLQVAWVNQGLDPRARATVLSMVEQFHSFGEIIGGPVLGGIAAAIAVEAGLVASAAFLLPVVGMYAVLVRRMAGAGSRPGAVAAPAAPPAGTTAAAGGAGEKATVPPGTADWS